MSLEKDDIVVIYSNGFTNILNLDEFIKQIIDFDKCKFEEYVNNKSLTDYEKFGKDKTLIIMKK